MDDMETKVFVQGIQLFLDDHNVSEYDFEVSDDGLKFDISRIDEDLWFKLRNIIISTQYSKKAEFTILVDCGIHLVEYKTLING